MQSTQLIQDLNRRYATKQFDPNKVISQESIQKLMEAVRLAPSSYGLQPRKFIVIRDQWLQDSLVEHAYGQAQVADASHLIVLCLKKNFWREDVDMYVNDMVDTRNIHKDNLMGFRDTMLQTVEGMSVEERTHRMQKQVYLALWFLLSTAAHLHIDACPMEWFVSDQFDRILWLENYQSVAVCPVWYRSEDDKYAHAKKVRFQWERVLERRTTS